MSSWRQYLSPEQLDRCLAIFPAVPRKTNGTKNYGPANHGWSIAQAPTSQEPHELRVYHRHPDGHLLEEWIVTRGGVTLAEPVHIVHDQSPVRLPSDDDRSGAPRYAELLA